ncbi:MAG: hypothetical protein GC131_08675 [Alphaproteobacteria bacterium]|nr:hypothetical protein [Alphaproteobacteria bacterium]
MSNKLKWTLIIIAALVILPLLGGGAWLFAGKPDTETVNLPAMHMLYVERTITERKTIEIIGAFYAATFINPGLPPCKKIAIQWFDNPLVTRFSKGYYRAGCLVDRAPAGKLEQIEVQTIPAQSWRQMTTKLGGMGDWLRNMLWMHLFAGGDRPYVLLLWESDILESAKKELAVKDTDIVAPQAITVLAPAGDVAEGKPSAPAATAEEE